MDVKVNTPQKLIDREIKKTSGLYKYEDIKDLEAQKVMVELEHTEERREGSDIIFPVFL